MVIPETWMPPMITLYQFPPLFGVANPSPFCLKVETYLRMSGLSFRSVPLGDARKAPKGKLPYIVDGARTVADSAFIIDYLKAQHDADLDAHLDPVERAVAHAFAVMLEEHYYWAVVYMRWVGPNWEQTRQELQALLPPVLRHVLPSVIHRQIKGNLHAQGLGRHSEQELVALAHRDMEAVAAYLGEKPFLMGDQPCSADATLYGLLGSVLEDHLQNPLKNHLLTLPVLQSYQQRIRQRYFNG